MMGAQQSSRKITIDNEEANNVIKLSEKVVERLKGSIVKDDEAPTRTSTKQPAPVFVEPKYASYEEKNRPSENEIRAQYEEVIKQNNQFWEKKIKALQDSHFKIDDVYGNEYKKALKDVEESFPRMPMKNPIVPCQDKKQQVLNCYLKNKSQPLLCSREVQDFSNCMSSTRIKLQSEGKLT